MPSGPDLFHRTATCGMGSGLFERERVTDGLKAGGTANLHEAWRCRQERRTSPGIQGRETRRPDRNVLGGGS